MKLAPIFSAFVVASSATSAVLAAPINARRATEVTSTFADAEDAVLAATAAATAAEGTYDDEDDLEDNADDASDVRSSREDDEDDDPRDAPFSPLEERGLPSSAKSRHAPTSTSRKGKTSQAAPSKLRIGGRYPASRTSANLRPAAHGSKSQASAMRNRPGNGSRKAAIGHDQGPARSMRNGRKGPPTPPARKQATRSRFTSTIGRGRKATAAKGRPTRAQRPSSSSRGAANKGSASSSKHRAGCKRSGSSSGPSCDVQNSSQLWQGSWDRSGDSQAAKASSHDVVLNIPPGSPAASVSGLGSQPGHSSRKKGKQRSPPQPQGSTLQGPSSGSTAGQHATNKGQAASSRKSAKLSEDKTPAFHPVPQRTWMQSLNPYKDYHLPVHGGPKELTGLRKPTEAEQLMQAQRKEAADRKSHRRRVCVGALCAAAAAAYYQGPQGVTSAVAEGLRSVSGGAASAAQGASSAAGALRKRSRGSAL